jgi:colicin import membrane protein
MSSEKEAGQVLTSENAADFYSSKLGLADNSQTPEAETSEPVEEAEQSEPSEEKEAKPTEERKQNPKLEKRFSEITKQREQARQEAQQEREARQKLEAEIAAIRQQQQPQQAKNADEKPQPSQFTDAFEYAEALADWSAEQALVRRDKEDLQRRADEAQQKVISSWANKVAAAKAEIPDFDDMVASSGVAVSDPIRDAILESDVGPQILYHLAKEDDLAKKIASMSPYAALREIGKLEAKFEKQPETKASNPVGKSKAPPPISPIRNAGNANNVEIGSDGQFHGSYQAWKTARKAGRIR